MTNPIIETDIAVVLAELKSGQDKILEKVTNLEVRQVKLEGKIEALDERLSGKIEALDERLSGKIEALDEKLSGKITTLDTKTSQMDIRLVNIETINSRIFTALLASVFLAAIGFLAKLFGMI